MTSFLKERAGRMSKICGSIFYVSDFLNATVGWVLGRREE